MPYKDRAKRLEYSMKYNKKTRHPEPEILEADDPEIPKKTVDRFLDEIEKATVDPDTGKPDKWVGVIKTVVKHAPEFIKGFQEAARMAQEFSAQQAPQQREPRETVQAPDGWVHMGAMERLKYKYSRPEWYAAGERYDDWNRGGSSSVNTAYVDPTYGEQPSRRKQPQIAQGNEPRSLRELSTRYPDPPLASDKPLPAAKEVSAKPGDHIPADKLKEQNIVYKSDDKKEEQPMPKEKQSQLEQAIAQVQADTQRYIVKSVEKVNKLSDEEFKTWLDKPKDLLQKFVDAQEWFPVQLNALIENTHVDDFIALIEKQCPAKYKIVSDAGKLADVREFMVKVKKVVEKAAKGSAS